MAGLFRDDYHLDFIALLLFARQWIFVKTCCEEDSGMKNSHQNEEPRHHLVR